MSDLFLVPTPGLRDTSKDDGALVVEATLRKRWVWGSCPWVRRGTDERCEAVLVGQDVTDQETG